MLGETALAKVLAGLPAVSVTGPWTRVLGYHLLQGPPPGALPASSPQPLWPGGAAANGARFTPKGSFGTVYLASDPITALKEVVAIFVTPFMPLGTLRTPPWAVFAVDGFVESVLDLTDQSVLDALGTTVSELTGDWRFSQALFETGAGAFPPTQLLGKLAYDSGPYQGLRYRSAKDPAAGVGLAVFPDRLVEGGASFVEVHDPNGLIAQRLP